MKTQLNKENSAAAVAEKTVFSILISISVAHLLNDTLQSLIPSIYPLLKDTFHLNFAQVGLITLTFQLAASFFQPFVGWYTDKRPQPYSLAVGMIFTLAGLCFLSFANHFNTVLLSVGLIGVGSSIFHPEASKIAYMASGGRRGMAQSVFQVGGNTGSAIGPLLAAAIIVPFGRSYILVFGILAIIAIILLMRVARWAKAHLQLIGTRKIGSASEEHLHFSRKKIIITIAILLVLIFSKYFYLASISSYYTFYLIEKFGVSVQSSQVHLFIFLAAAAAGTYIGGPLGDRFGRKYVIWFSILGAAPFTLLLPYANLFWISILSILIAFVLSSAFSAILVYAQELLPGKIGMVSGLFFGFAFGMGGLGSALIGALADHTSIFYVFKVCSFLPLIGLITGLLPNIKAHKISPGINK